MAAAAAALALMLAACGSSDADDAADPVTSATLTDDIGEAGTDAGTTESASDTTSTAPPATDDATAQAPGDAAVVPDILQFSAPLVGGGTFDGAAVAGTPTAFWFWAPT